MFTLIFLSSHFGERFFSSAFILLSKVLHAYQRWRLPIRGGACSESYCNNVRTYWELAFAWASIAAPACCSTWPFATAALSAA